MKKQKHNKMKEATQITVILPVHELDDKTRPYFANAIKSIETQLVTPDAVLVVVPKDSDVSKELSAYDYGKIKDIVKVIENGGSTDFSSQVNFGVENSETEWVSILELDDEYARIWFKNVQMYMKAHSNVDLFLPIIIDVNAKQEFLGLTNEAVWAQSFSDELGVLNEDALLAYQNFNLDGAVMRKSLFEEFGGLKSNLKLTFVYEFLLRMTFKDNRVFVIPRFGYKHMNQREGSLFHKYANEIDPVEARWWLSQAKKEYYFDLDRKLTYEAETK